jgi:Spy/CpxP family protein refolding chaperone
VTRAGVLLLASTLYALFAGHAWAEEMLAVTGRWWHNEQVVKRLELTTDEVTALQAAYSTSRRNLIALKGQLEVAQFELESLLESPELDAAAARAQYQRLEAARTELGSERFAFLLEVRRIVGFERFQKLLQIQRVARQRKQP